ncbi:Protein eyes shut [Manis javanica]|nr:Protein eyes shut [Manis javanica]
MHIGNCKSEDSTLWAAPSFVAPAGAAEGTDSLQTSLGLPAAAPSACQEDMCHPGGTCHPVFLAGGIVSFQCDCPLHFTGRACEQVKV